jgi:GntR family transcriptional regulator, transcriptional repressor for pyruvate dehydrogenase complex
MNPLSSAAPTKRALKLSETVAKQIVDDIYSQGLQPGSKLPPEREMLERYDVSRGTLREALRILEVHGLLVIKSGPYGGPHLSEMTAADFNRACSLHFSAAGITVRSLWQARVNLEPVLARLASENLTASTVNDLTTLLERAKGESVAVNVKFIEIGKLFHEAIAAASGNPILSLFARSLGEMTTHLASQSIYPPSQHDRVHEDHIQIIEAILAGESNRVEALMRVHMEEMRTTYSASYSAVFDTVLPYI